MSEITVPSLPHPWANATTNPDITLSEYPQQSWLTGDRCDPQGWTIATDAWSVTAWPVEGRWMFAASDDDGHRYRGAFNSIDWVAWLATSPAGVDTLVDHVITP
jgi:hypothetical protein